MTCKIVLDYIINLIEYEVNLTWSAANAIYAVHLSRMVQGKLKGCFEVKTRPKSVLVP